jgi:hypothetical protein
MKTLGSEQILAQNTILCITIIPITSEVTGHPWSYAAFRLVTFKKAPLTVVENPLKGVEVTIEVGSIERHRDYSGCRGR